MDTNKLRLVQNKVAELSPEDQLALTLVAAVNLHNGLIDAIRLLRKNILATNDTAEAIAALPTLMGLDNLLEVTDKILRSVDKVDSTHVLQVSNAQVNEVVELAKNGALNEVVTSASDPHEQQNIGKLH